MPTPRATWPATSISARCWRPRAAIRAALPLQATAAGRPAPPSTGSGGSGVSHAGTAEHRRQYGRCAGRAGGLRRQRRAVPGQPVLHHRADPHVAHGDHRKPGLMSLFSIFNIAGSGMAAQSVRLNTTASNLANAESVSGDPTRRLQAAPPDLRGGARAAATAAGNEGRSAAACACAASTRSRRRPSARYEPGNPLADANGYVYRPT